MLAPQPLGCFRRCVQLPSCKRDVTRHATAWLPAHHLAVIAISAGNECRSSVKLALIDDRGTGKDRSIAWSFKQDVHK